MMSRRWLRDTIARRFALTIILAFAATMAMNVTFAAFAGVWGQPSIAATGLLNSAFTATRIVESRPPAERASIAQAAGTDDYQLRWFSGEAPIAPGRRLRNNFGEALSTMRRLLNDPDRTIVFFDANSPEVAASRLAKEGELLQDAYYMAVQLIDDSWLLFIVPERRWGISAKERAALEALFSIISIMSIAGLTARSLAEPVEGLARAVQRFGTDPKAPPIALSGPLELRETISAFNAMQARIGRFVQDRTIMLAAISHDLRTPLTRMRLRAELIDDPQQQDKLFRDVDEMQSMVDSALSFFRDDASSEEATSFNLPELLKSILDGYGDQGITIPYHGPDGGAFVGRPFALRRVFMNLIENAVKYAEPPSVCLSFTEQGAEVSVRDTGPGIPAEALEQVFLPFHRLDHSRNRMTGGVGLGLTAARSIVRAHGGDIQLENLVTGGLLATVLIPRI
jgi:signal transduction histidine kinase